MPGARRGEARRGAVVALGLAGLALVSATAYGAVAGTGDSMLARLGAAASAAPSTGAARATQRAADEFTACMRAGGVPGFPGVTVSANGSLLFDVGPGDPWIDVSSPTFRKAFETCQHFLPAWAALPTPTPPAVPTPPSPTIPMPPGAGCCPAIPPGFATPKPPPAPPPPS